MTDSLFPDPQAPAAEAAGPFIAHCDGGSRGNPGPAGFAAVIENPRGQIVARLSEYLGRQTNNYAEYAGLLAVLRWAVEHRAGFLRVVSDSELMVNQMKGRYKVASPVLRPLWEEARRLSGQLDRFEMRHTLRGGNQEADRLANDAMDRGMGKKRGEEGRPSPPPAPGSAGATRPGRQVFEGLVKNGVVHLIEGDLPEGILVKVIRE